MSDSAAEHEAPPPVHYPESDGKPMAESELHGDTMIHLRQALRHLFREEANVYVGSNNFLYYREGDPRAARAPDIYVVRGVPKKPPRRVFKLWEEGVAPQLVVEVTSKSTQREDLWEKRALYEELGVVEYLLFDPEAEYLEPAFQAFRLGTDRSYEPVDLPLDGRFESTVFDLAFLPEGPFLRVLDGEGVVVLDHGEALAQAEEATRQAEEAAHRAEEATRQAEDARRRAERAEEELRRLRAGQGPGDSTG